MSTASTNDVPSVTIERLFALRYLTIAGIVVFIYDFSLTFSDELDYIWHPIMWRVRRRGRSALKLPRPIVLYVIARYSMLTIGILYLSDLIPSRNLTTNWCQGSAVFVFSIDVIVEALSCGVVLHRLFFLWEFSRLISRIVLWVFSFAKVVMFSFAGLAIALTKNDLSFIIKDNLRFCGVSGSSRFFLGVWVTCVAFDVFAFALLLLNALSRPRSVSERLLKILYEDGIIFFLTIFTMRSLNLIISAAAPPSLIILGIVFSASMVSTVVSRSFLRLQAHARRDALLGSARGSSADGTVSVLDGDSDSYALQSTGHIIDKSGTQSTEECV